MSFVCLTLLTFDNANKNGNGDFFAVKNITQSLKGGFCLCLTQYKFKNRINASTGLYLF